MMTIVKDRILYRLLNRIISFMQINEHWVTHSSLKIKRCVLYCKNESSYTLYTRVISFETFLANASCFFYCYLSRVAITLIAARSKLIFLVL